MGRIIYRDFYLTTQQADELVEKGKDIYVVFEEPNYERGLKKGKSKSYDLTQAIFADIEIARKFVESDGGEEPLYIANYADYIAGNYDYL